MVVLTDVVLDDLVIATIPVQASVILPADVQSWVVQEGLGFDVLVCLRRQARFQVAAAAAAADDAIWGCCLVGLIDLKKYPVAGMTTFDVASLEDYFVAVWPSESVAP